MERDNDFVTCAEESNDQHRAACEMRIYDCADDDNAVIVGDMEDSFDITVDPNDTRTESEYLRDSVGNQATATYSRSPVSVWRSSWGQTEIRRPTNKSANGGGAASGWRAHQRCCRRLEPVQPPYGAEAHGHRRQLREDSAGVRPHRRRRRRGLRRRRNANQVGPFAPCNPSPALSTTCAFSGVVSENFYCSITTKSNWRT